VAQELTVSGVLLAAGAGTRFGMPKVLADGGGWLRLAVAALHRGGCGDVVVVLGAATDVDLPAPARAVIAEDWAHGVSASVRAGLQSLPESAAFAVLTTVDTPDVDERAVRRVLDAARAAESGLARARYGDRPGHPVAIARRHWPRLLDTLTGDEGAGPFLRARADVVAVDCADLGSGRDIDER
jgi:CTP:molybdopterin cytidylyltransferase MocA